jgi:hypothetical protein
VAGDCIAGNEASCVPWRWRSPVRSRLVAGRVLVLMIALHQLIFSMSFGMQNPLGSSFYEN